MQFLNALRHIDEYIGQTILQFGPWSYLILFAIIFCETGLVVMPFLPGDSLLFAAGLFAAKPEYGLNIWLLLLILTFAPLCGDSVNYALGKRLGPRIFSDPKRKFLNPKNLKATHDFFEKHGPKAIIIARWVPVVRTFAPFVAGMGAMEYRKFIGFSFLGAFMWVWICVGAGFFLGNIPVVKQNFELAMLALIAVSGGPVMYEALKHRRNSKREAGQAIEAIAETTDPEDKSSSVTEL